MSASVASRQVWKEHGQLWEFYEEKIGWQVWCSRRKGDSLSVGINVTWASRDIDKACRKRGRTSAQNNILKHRFPIPTSAGKKWQLLSIRKWRYWVGWTSRSKRGWPNRNYDYLNYHVCGFYHTCVDFTKYLRHVKVFGKNHTCVGRYKHVCVFQNTGWFILYLLLYLTKSFEILNLQHISLTSDPGSRYF